MVGEVFGGEKAIHFQRIKCLNKIELTRKIIRCLEFFKMSGKKLFTWKERNVWKNNEMSGIFKNVWKKAIYLERKKCLEK